MLRLTWAPFRPLLATVVAAGIVLSPAAASAAPIFFFGEDLGAGGSLPVPNSVAAQSSFLASLLGVRVETFETIAAGTQFPIAIAFGPDVATLSGTNTVFNTGIASSGIAGRFAVSGSQYLNVGTGDALSFQLTFSTPQAAFGFFATDIGDVGGQLAVRLDGGPQIIVPHTLNSPDGAGLFFGIIDAANPFTTVQFLNTQGSADAFGFDDFTIGRVDQVAAVPEPSSIALVASGALLPLIQLARRRRVRRG